MCGVPRVGNEVLMEVDMVGMEIPFGGSVSAPRLETLLVLQRHYLVRETLACGSWYFQLRRRKRNRNFRWRKVEEY